MSDLITNTAAVYMNIGVTGLIIVVLVVTFFWWITKGRKRAEDLKIRAAEELARIGKIIENNTAVINNNSKVIEANTSQRQTDQHCLESMLERMSDHGKQLDEVVKTQAICVEIHRQMKK